MIQEGDANDRRMIPEAHSVRVEITLAERNKIIHDRWAPRWVPILGVDKHIASHAYAADPLHSIRDIAD
jgi:hypothetical protein